MRRSRKELEARVADQDACIQRLQDACIQRLIEERDQHKEQALANVRALRLIGRELSDLKDEVALHIVAAEHPSSALSDAASMALSLREACEARGIDLRLELTRLEGSQL